MYKKTQTINTLTENFAKHVMLYDRAKAKVKALKCKNKFKNMKQTTQHSAVVWKNSNTRI